jgi:hypothetical protein
VHDLSGSAAKPIHIPYGLTSLTLSRESIGRQPERSPQRVISTTDLISRVGYDACFGSALKPVASHI